MIQYRTLISNIDSPSATGANIVALDGDQLVASLGLRLGEPGGFINSLFVAATHRGQGIGRDLVQLAAHLAMTHGKPTIGLSVCDQNHDAQGLYKSLGFRPFSRVHDGYQQYVAMLPLQSPVVLRVEVEAEAIARLSNLHKPASL